MSAYRIQTQSFDDVDGFLSYIKKESSQHDCLFRGHSDSSWFLQPSAFRDDVIRSRARLYYSKVARRRCYGQLNYEHANNSCKECQFALGVIQNDWFKHQKLERYWDRVNYDHNAKRRLYRVLYFVLFCMQYNFYINEHFTRTKNKSKQMSAHILKIDKYLKLPRLVEMEYYIDYLTQTCFLERVFDIYSIDGSLIQPASPDNITTELDETFPQHYDCSTSALDWSSNHLVALFFSLGIDLKTNMAEIDQNKFLSLYAWKDAKN